MKPDPTAHTELNPESVLLWPKPEEGDCIIRRLAHAKLDELQEKNPHAEVREEQGTFRIYSGPQYRPKAS